MLQKDFEDDFPRHLSMSILDEAAATAETYVPLVIRLWDFKKKGMFDTFDSLLIMFVNICCEHFFRW